MKRSPALAALSRDHHEALAVALRLRQADAESAPAACERFAEYFGRRGARHFELEEAVLGPVIRELSDGEELERRLLREHARLRALGDALDDLQVLGEELTAHVRWEERELFPLLEAHLDEERLAALGRALDAED